MGNFNVGRAILGGLVAGLIVDIFDGALNGAVLAARWAAFAQAHGHDTLMSPSRITAVNVLGLATGIVAVWLYGAVRTRSGAGPETAIRTGLVTWVLVNAIPNAYMVAIGILPMDLVEIAIGVGIIEYPLAVLAGAALYKESAVQARAASAAGKSTSPASGSGSVANS